MNSPTIISTINKLPIGKTFAHLIRREFIEHRGSYFFVPLFLGLLMLAFVLITLVGNYITGTGDIIGNISFNEVNFSNIGDILEKLQSASLEVREKVMSVFITIVSAPLIAALPFVMVFSVLSCLFDDRKNKSILFLKSLPFSDTQEVTSKLISAIILAPLLTIVLVFVFQLAFLVIAALVVAFNGGNVWDIVWAPVPIFTQPLGIFFSLVVVILWQLPFWGWLTLVSAIAPRVPFLIASVPLVIVVLLEEIFYQTQIFANFMHNVIALNFAHIFENISVEKELSFSGFDVNIITPGDAFQVMGESLGMGNFYGMVALGSALILGAIYIRKSNINF